MQDLLKVLLIDDNPDDRLLIIRELRKLFVIDVEEIIDSKDFGDALSRLDFDIVITDYQLRWTTGIEILLKIRSVKAMIPVIMFTGTGSEEIAVMAMKIGLDDYILKTPQHYNRLAISVKSAIGRMADEMGRKYAENALKKSEENYRTLVENIGLGFSRIDKDLNIVMVNAAQARMFGRTPGEFTGLKHHDLYEKSLTSYFFSGDNPDFTQGGSAEAITQGIRPDGSKFEVHLRTFPALDDKGEIVGYIEIAEDISGRVRSERIQEVAYNIANAVILTGDLGELYQNIRQELSRVVETTNFRLILKDEKTGKISIPYCVDEFDPVCQLPEGDLLTRMVIEKEQALLIARPEMMTMLNTGLIDSVDPRFQQLLGVPLKSKKSVIGALVLISYSHADAFSSSDLDIMQFVSNQIGIAVDNKRTADHLRESELKFRSLIEQSTDGVLMVDSHGVIVEWNSAACSITGILSEIALGQRIWELQYDLMDFQVKDESYRSYLAEMYENLLTDFRGRRSVVVEEHNVTVNGHSRVLQVTYFPLMINDLLHVGAFLRDFTEQKATSLAINLAKRRAEESDRLKTAFLSNISHEIRTPLNAIVGFAALMAEEEVNDATRKVYSEKIFENSRGLLYQFNNIIEISKIESGAFSLDFYEFEVNDFLESIRHQAAGLIASQKVEFRMNLPVDHKQLLVKTDRQRLRQVLNQLLTNAFKFSQAGFVELGYYLDTTDYIVFYVKDSGPGIPAEMVELVFDRFRQLDESIDRKFTGMGIGLNIVKKIVNLLNGQVTCEEVKPHGTLFKVFLPLNHPTKETGMDNKIIDNIASTTDKWIGKTILIVEDVESNYQFLAATLRRSGAELLWSKVGEEAIELVKSGTKIDLVLMDVQLAGIDGYEVTRQMKSLRPDLPVIAQTAYAMIGEKEKSQDAGCDEYLAKPIRPSLLISTISNYL